MLVHRPVGGQHAEPEQRCCNGRFLLPNRVYPLGVRIATLGRRRETRLPRARIVPPVCMTPDHAGKLAAASTARKGEPRRLSRTPLRALRSAANGGFKMRRSTIV